MAAKMVASLLASPLCKGQLATVLQLPVRAGVSANDAQPQKSTAVVDEVAPVHWHG
jgi:hypothetical protein